MIVSPKNTRDILLQATSTRVSANFLSMAEKPSIIPNYNNIINTKDILSAEADKYGISAEKSNYISKVSALTSYLAGLTTPVLWSNLNNITFVTRDDFDQKFIDVSVAEKALKDVLTSRSTIEAYLTVPSVSMTADQYGTVSGGILASSGGTFKVLAGITDITASGVSYSVISQSNCTVTINSIGVYYPTSISSSNATATLRATLSSTYGSKTIDRTYSLSRVNTGSPGPKGDNGSQGAQARIAYTLIDGSSMNTSPSSIVVTGDNVPTAGSWGATRAWQTTAYTSIAANQALYQSSGLFDPATGYTTWGVPYLSSLKVGTLSAITTDTGTLIIGSTGHLRGGQTSYNSGSGFWLGYDSGSYKLSIGNSSTNFTYDGTKLVIRAANGSCEIGDSSLSPTFSFTRTSTTTLPSILITDISTSTSQMLVVQNSASFAGNQLVSFSAQKGETLRAVTVDGTQYSSVIQNLGGSTTALAIAGPTYSGFASSGDGIMNIADGYLPFTGVHICMLPIGVEYEIGDVVVTTKSLFSRDISNSLLEIDVSSKANDKCVLGVINGASEYENYLNLSMQEWYELQEKYVGIHVNALGEGCINVCGMNGDIEIGDLLTTSTIRGKAMRQDDDIIRSKSIAKSTKTVTFEYPEQVKQISCTYLAG